MHLKKKNDSKNKHIFILQQNSQMNDSNKIFITKANSYFDFISSSGKSVHFIFVHVIVCLMSIMHFLIDYKMYLFKNKIHK